MLTTSLGRSLMQDIGVSPVPRHGGALEGREGHRLSAKYPLICGTLAPYMSGDMLAALRRGWADCAAIFGTLNTAADVPFAEIESFTRLSRGLVPPLPVAFPLLSVTSKLHALANPESSFL